MKHFISVCIGFGIGAIFFGGFLIGRVTAPQTSSDIVSLPEGVACTAEAMQCPDGTFVGRTGPDCQFVCPDGGAQIDIDTSEIDALQDRIVVTMPALGATISSPLQIAGQARGNWFFEASFPVTLVNWDGLIIAEGIATAGTDWMTEEFVPFTAELTFESPYNAGNPAYMARGSLILQRDNPSGLPEHDAALEIPVVFAPGSATISQ